MGLPGAAAIAGGIQIDGDRIAAVGFRRGHAGSLLLLLLLVLRLLIMRDAGDP